MIPLRQSTASQEVPLGYFLDSADGNTEENPTIANTDIKLWKHGASALVNKNSGGSTQMSGGLHYCTLDATDTNTVGGLIIYVHVSGSLALKQECTVYPANVYDALFGSDYLQVDTMQIEGSDATNQLTSALATYDVPTNTELNARTLPSANYFDPASDTVLLSTATMQAIAAELIKYDVANVEDTAAADSLAAVILATFFGEVSGNTFNVYKTDGATLFASTSVTTDANADPITAVGV